jgi:hypothetical protein
MSDEQPGKPPENVEPIDLMNANKRKFLLDQAQMVRKIAESFAEAYDYWQAWEQRTKEEFPKSNLVWIANAIDHDPYQIVGQPMRNIANRIAQSILDAEAEQRREVET